MKYSLNFRIWHWLNAFVVLGLLSTVFLRKTFLSWRTNSEILMSELQSMGTEISVEQAKILAKAVRAGMWEWHIILGYALVGLILFRFYLYLKESSPRAKFDSLTTHKKAVRSLYYLLYATLVFMALSGLSIHFYQELNITKELAHDIKELHELVFYLVMFFVPLHLAGVVISDLTEKRGLVSSMINGRKRDDF